jgi:hypothetical protein
MARTLLTEARRKEKERTQKQTRKTERNHAPAPSVSWLHLALPTAFLALLTWIVFRARRQSRTASEDESELLFAQMLMKTAHVRGRRQQSKFRRFWHDLQEQETT